MYLKVIYNFKYFLKKKTGKMQMSCLNGVFILKKKFILIQIFNYAPCLHHRKTPDVMYIDNLSLNNFFTLKILGKKIDPSYKCSEK